MRVAGIKVLPQVIAAARPCAFGGGVDAKVLEGWVQDGECHVVQSPLMAALNGWRWARQVRGAPSPAAAAVAAPTAPTPAAIVA